VAHAVGAGMILSALSGEPCPAFVPGGRFRTCGLRPPPSGNLAQERKKNLSSVYKMTKTAWPAHPMWTRMSAPSRRAALRSTVWADIEVFPLSGHDYLSRDTARCGRPTVEYTVHLPRANGEPGLRVPDSDSTRGLQNPNNQRTILDHDGRL
jgi:hypothetical protein